MGSTVTDEMAMALLHGVDVDNRRVFLHGDVEEGTIGLVIRALYWLAAGSDPVELFISSYGGQLDDAFALHDVTRTIAVPVHTVALGKCMSAAPMLVACGRPGERYATENTIFMLHDAWLYAEGRPRGVESVAQAAKVQMRTYSELLGQYTDKPASHWRRLMAKGSDEYFSAEQAVDWGLVDAIWEE